MVTLPVHTPAVKAVVAEGVIATAPPVPAPLRFAVPVKPTTVLLLWFRAVIVTVKAAPRVFGLVIVAQPKLCKSLSITLMFAVPLVNPAALAVIVTVAFVSTTASFGAVSVKLADVAPAAIVAEAGTERRGLLEESDTTSGVVSVPEIDTVADPVAPSVMLACGVTVRLVFSLSDTASGAVAPVQPTTDALITRFCVPSMRLSSMAVMRKSTLVLPPGITTVAGTDAFDASLEANVTVMGLALTTLRVTVANTAPVPSVVVVGTVRVRAAVSLSSTVKILVPGPIPAAVAVIVVT